MLYNNSMLDWRTEQLALFLDALDPKIDVQFFVANSGQHIVKTHLTYGSAVPTAAEPGDRIYYRNQRCHALIDPTGRQVLPTGFYDGPRPLYETTVLPIEFDRREVLNEFKLDINQVQIPCGAGKRVHVILSPGLPTFALQLAPIDSALTDALDIELVGPYITLYRKATDSARTDGRVRVYLGTEYRDLYVKYDPWCSIKSTSMVVEPSYLDLDCAQTSIVRVTGGTGPIELSLNSYHFSYDLNSDTGEIRVTRNLTNGPAPLSGELVVVRGDESAVVTLTGDAVCKVVIDPPPPADCENGPLTNRWAPGEGYVLSAGQHSATFSGVAAPHRLPDQHGIDQDRGVLVRARSRVSFSAGKVYQELRFVRTSPYLNVDHANAVPVSQFVALVSTDSLEHDADKLWSFPHVAVDANGRFGTLVQSLHGLTSRQRRRVPGHWHIGDGSVVGIAVDLDHPRTPVWISIDGHWLGRGDPANGVNPYQYLAQRGAQCYTFCAFFHTAYGPVFEARLNRCWAFDPPTGFGPPVQNCEAPVTNALGRAPEVDGGPN